MARIHEPVHTLVSSVSGGWLRMNSCSRVLYVSGRVPGPPGSRTAFIAGRLAKS